MQDEDQQTITVEVEVEGRYDSEPTLVAPQVSPEIRYALETENLLSLNISYLLMEARYFWTYWEKKVLMECNGIKGK